jgi:hypothetical protein
VTDKTILVLHVLVLMAVKYNMLRGFVWELFTEATSITHQRLVQSRSDVQLKASLVRFSCYGFRLDMAPSLKLVLKHPSQIFDRSQRYEESESASLFRCGSRGILRVV